MPPGLALLALALALAPTPGARRLSRVQHGPCAYTFVLPELDAGCAGDALSNNALQRDAPHAEPEPPARRLQHLEHAMENYTQWLQKVSPGALGLQAPAGAPHPGECELPARVQTSRRVRALLPRVRPKLARLGTL